ncbi:MAG: hypothetical protein RLZZ129_1480 [Verrucomicrobiota bacterium]
MTALHIDFETRSTVDLKKTGTYVYAEHPNTDLWCAAYAFGEEPVALWLPGQPCPPRVADHVAEGGTLIAHNAAFERVIWKHILAPRHGWPEPAIEQWRCTMVMALAMALPGSLENAAGAVGLDLAKDMEGHALMLRMARPRRIDALGNPVWWDVPERKERLFAYCRQDVEVERQLEKRLLQLRPSELALWHLDQKINDRGVHVDVALCEAAKRIVAAVTERLNAEMAAVTDHEVSSCSAVSQLTAWVRSRGVATDALAKDDIDELLATEIPDDVRRALELRREAGKASVAKIDALLRGMNADGRARGLLQFHAASTGRWAGRRFQPQNIKRPELEGDDLTEAIRAVRTGNADLVEALFGPPLSVVGDCLRGMIDAQ